MREGGGVKSMPKATEAPAAVSVLGNSAHEGSAVYAKGGRRECLS